MKLNKHGPHLWFTATRGDPDIGRLKRGRAPCPSTLITLLTKRKAGVADGLDANCLTRRIMSKWERYGVLNGVRISFNAVRTSTLTGLKRIWISDLSACVAPDSVKESNWSAMVTGLNRHTKSEHVRISLNAIRSSTLTGLNKFDDLSACVAPDSVNSVKLLN